MILLKANSETKTVFQKMIKTTGENVKWTEIFVINNNDIILVGEGRSLFFNFDSRRVFSNIVDLPIDGDKASQITENVLLVNTLNMILYVFGKWGGIKGLTVEQDYDRLNRLINSILGEIDVESGLTKDNFRFYKDGIQVTYEEVIQLILDKIRSEDDEESEKEPEEEEPERKQEDDNREAALGLWHNICWSAGSFSFEKEELTESDRVKSRLGNNFYMVNYKCPLCGEKLYMVVYPPGREFRIETDEEAVYLARAYTCNAGNNFYTPKPHKLLIEGEVYTLAFEDDRAAYEDYLELLGRQGERTSNAHFNEYESEYMKNREPSPQLEEICDNMDSMTEDEILQLRDKMDSGFYPEKSIDKYYKRVDKELNSREPVKSRYKGNIYLAKESEDNEAFSDKPVKYSLKKQGPLSVKRTIVRHVHGSVTGAPEIENTDTAERNRQNKRKTIRKGNRLDKRKIPGKGTREQGIAQYNSLVSEAASEISDDLREALAAIKKGEQDVFDGKAEKFSSKQLKDLKLLIHSEQNIDKNEKNNYIDRIDRKELNWKAASGKEKNYTELLYLIDEIKNEDCADSVKKPILDSLTELLKDKGKKELEHIVSRIPATISKRQYSQFREKIGQYKEIDNSPYEELLDERRDAVEKQEIAAFIKRANAADRNSLSDLHRKLKELDYEERNVNSFLEAIHDRIYAIDEAAIKRICPEPADITFDEGIQMYEEISSGIFLPELKSNILGMIDKRLRKLKMDECEQLVKKLRKDMKWTEEKYPRIFFYDTRNRRKSDADDTESAAVHNALNTYAESKSKYEYPILICNASYSMSGKAGFVLTPDHIFYNTPLTSGVMKVTDIEHVFAGSGLLSKGIYVNLKNGGKVKISNSFKLIELESFAGALNDFVSYLKEKPASRDISYLAKEKHTVKCCYRCGYVYKGGNVCPKCGSKFNE